MTATGPEAVFDLRSYEPDRQGRAARLTVGGSTSAGVRVAHREGRTIYHQRILTPTVALPSEPPLVPPFALGPPHGALD